MKGNLHIATGLTKAIKYGLLSLSILVLILQGAAAAPRQRRQQVEEAVRLIKAVAQEEVADSKSAIVIRPFYVSGKKNGISWIDYNLGAIEVDNMGLPSGDPYKLPYAMQIQVEALRKVFQENAGQESFWQAPLQKAEELVTLTVIDILKASNQTVLDSKLSGRSQAFINALGELEKSIEDYARRKGLQIGEPGVGRRNPFGGGEKFSVQINTNPAGGIVRVVTAFVWRACLKKNCNKGELTWRTLNAEKEDMIGGYHYIVEWPDQKRDEGDITVESDGKRTFPSPAQ